MTQPIKTPIEPGIVARVAAGLRLMVTGQAPDWFGPQQPLPEVVPPEQRSQVTGRQFDFPVGFNTQTRPRTGEAVTFDQMRALADNYDILRLVIETRKDQMEKLQWHIKPKDEKAKPDSRCDTLNKFFQKPDQEHGWSTWLRMLLEDLLVIDAPTIYPRPTLGGDLYALEPVDGATIKRVLDDFGRTPMPPEPAYQQILKGVPAINYTREELIYRPRNLRTHKVYGFSPVEQIIVTVNIALRRQANQLSYYTEGNVPNLLFQVPKDWNPDQIKQFQLWWDTVTQGNSKHYGRFIPEGATPVEIKQPPLKDMYDEWLARVVCFCFSIEPTPFVAQVNRAVAETSRQQSLAEGLAPMKNWVKALVDSVIADYFGIDDLEFGWVDEEVTTPKERAEIAAIYTGAKVITPDEIRADLGKDPLTDEQREKAWPAPPPMPGIDDPEGDEEDGQPPGKAPAEKEAVVKAKKGLRPIDRERRAVGRARKKMAKAVGAFLKAQAPKIAAQLADLMGLEKSDQGGGVREKARHIVESIDFADWEDLIDIAEPFLATMAVSGGAEALTQIGIEADDIDDLMRERAEAWAQDRAAEMVGMRRVGDDLVPNPGAHWRIDEGTRDMLRGLTEQALEEGWSVQEMASQIEDANAFSEARAEMIARTELAKADVAGSMEGYRASGVVQGKRWITAEDDLVSDECKACGDAGVIGIDDVFPSGEDAPPNHPNCRCAVVPVLDDEDDAQSLGSGKEALAKGFNPDQPRDDHGRFAGDGGSIGSLHGLAEKAISDPVRKAAHDLGPVSQSNVAAVKRNTKLDVSGYRRTAHDDYLRHAKKSHGETATEKKRGQRAVTLDDYKQLGKVVSKPDSVTMSQKTHRGLAALEYRKVIGGEEFVYVEAIRPKDYRLEFVSFRIHSSGKAQK
ncbi:phage putative head morphogenesis protein, SPP1 gp7 family [Azospira oryzae PS]|uniref:Phage putative head morphogenesis protein, SPP1 gp7 family n=1 Tax=Azospira oryzae (strain ATCC BAA-33 / DSM 13638 / PS) TaxID=640081 RepID=G8QMN4_AZOOP|nr:phage portal protein [Azospira oryzae]AEV24614.1 phage putative head morphogenesis protein, SPP1 gp7 family [Azospira oryzae PS]